MWRMDSKPTSSGKQNGKRFHLSTKEASVQRPGCATQPDVKSFLGDPFKGGRPEDVDVVVDWEAFVGRHTAVFDYDATTKKLRLRETATREVQGPTDEAETGLVQRLISRLRDGPGHAGPVVWNHQIVGYFSPK